MRIPSALIAMIAASSAMAAPDIATEETYELSLAGIDIGEAVLTLDAQGENYAVTVDGGYSFLFWSGAARIEAAGVRGEAGLSPRSYRSRLVSSTRDVRTEIDFDDSGVSDAEFRSEPPFDPKEFGDRVPVEDDDLVGARDPVSAFLILAKTGAEACSGLLPVFSGIVRFDLRLSAVESDDPSKSVCATEYQPVSGHRRESGEVDRLRESGLDIAFFEIAPGLWAPERLGFRTLFGTLALERKPTVRGQ